MPSRPLVALLAVYSLALLATPLPGAGADLEMPSAAEVEATLPQGTARAGRELYDRFIKNKRRLRAAYQEGRIVSADPAGNPQLTRFWLQWQDQRDAADEPVDGVIAKALIKFTGPRELRHTGYLYIDYDGRADEQFMWSPSRQRTTRVDVRDQSIAGTDFSFDDFLVGLDELDDADYRRLADEQVDGVACWVVEAVMRPSSKARYTRSLAFLEKEHYVPLRMRYWDEAGIAVKELTAPRAAVREFDGAWIATESTMTDLLEGTHSTLTIDVLRANPPLDHGDFSIAILERMP